MQKIFFFIWALVLGSVVGCSWWSGKEKKISLASLTIQLPYEPVTLDPSWAEDGVSLRILVNTMEGLFGYDSNGILRKRLCKRYVIEKKGTRYRFFLRKNIQWSDGVAFEAKQVVTAFKRVLSPSSRSRFLSYFLPIQGAQLFRKTGKNLKGVYAVGRFEVVVDFKKPSSYFLKLLALPFTYPLRKDILKNFHGTWPLQAPTLGAYQVASHNLNHDYELVPNAHYWDFSQKNKLPRVKWLVVSNPSTAIHLFEQGKLDIVTKVSVYALKKYKNRPEFRSVPFLATYYIGFNVHQKPMDQLWVRQAIAGALDRKEMTHALGGWVQPAWSWIPKGLIGFIPWKEPQEVFQKALERWKREKWADKKIVLIYRYNDDEKNRLIAQVVKAQLKKKLGIQVQLEILDWKMFLQSLKQRPPHLFRLGWMAIFLDPLSHLQVFLSQNENNHTGWGNKKYDEMVNKITGLALGAERKKWIFKAQKMLLEEQTVLIPIYHYKLFYLVSSRVKQFQVNPFGLLRLADLKIN